MNKKKILGTVLIGWPFVGAIIFLAVFLPIEAWLGIGVVIGIIGIMVAILLSIFYGLSLLTNEADI